MRLRLTPQQAAEFALFVDAARVRAGCEGRTLVFTVHAITDDRPLPPGRDLLLGQPWPRRPHG